MRYIVTDRITGERYVWTRAEQGARSIEQPGSKSLPMTRDEARDFQDMEKAGERKSILPVSQYEID